MNNLNEIYVATKWCALVIANYFPTQKWEKMLLRVS